MTMKEYNSVKETLERLLPEDSKLRSWILSEFYEAKRKIAKSQISAPSLEMISNRIFKLARV